MGMNLRRIAAAITVAVLIVSTWGCGTAIGALAGATLGYAIGGKDGAIRGAALGAAVGAIVDYKVRQNQKVKSRQQAIAEVGYRGNGYHLSVRNAFANPQRVRPGSQTEVTCEWIAIAPSAQTSLRVDFALRMVYDGIPLEDWRKSSNSVDAGGGKVATTVAVSLPRSIDTGTYQLEMQLTTSGVTAKRFLPIYVV